MEPISPATYRAFCHDLLTLSDSFVRHDDELQILAVFFRNSPFILPFSFLFLPVHFCLHIMAIMVLRFSFYAITLDKIRPFTDFHSSGEFSMRTILHKKTQSKDRGFRLSLFLAGLLFYLASLSSIAKGQEIPCLHNSYVLGMSTVLSGPVAHLGINMRNGVLAALKEINGHGGIESRSLCLIVLDDGYEPERTVSNMHRLIAEKNVLAIIGNVGTPTAIAAVPIANRSHIPFFGAFTGAGNKLPCQLCRGNSRHGPGAHNIRAAEIR
jgi:hypothetical protein